MNPLLKEALDDIRAEVRMLRADNDRLSRMVIGLSTCAESRRVALEEALSTGTPWHTRHPEDRDAWRARIMKLAEGGTP